MAREGKGFCEMGDLPDNSMLDGHYAGGEGRRGRRERVRHREKREGGNRKKTEDREKKRWIDK